MEEALRDALSAWIGARLDAAHATPETGLVALSFYAGERKVLGVGIGPRVAGFGVLPSLPRLRADTSHPLVAAMRAHLVGHRLRAIGVAPEGLQLIVGGEEISARIELTPGRRGEARVISAQGDLVLRWPAGLEASPLRTEPRPAPARPTPAAAPIRIEVPGDLAAAGAALLTASEAAAAAAVKAAFARAARTRRAALERRADAVRGDLSRLERVESLQKIGRLLLAQGGRVPRGATRAALDDWEAGGAIEVALDPARPAKQQAEAYFAKARRYQRGEAVMRRRLAETERALEEARALEAEIAAVDARPEALDALSARARALGATGAGGGAPADARGRAGKTAARRPFHAFQSAAGAAILVGRGGKDNDALTTKHARPHDLWLHAKGVAGAHVVVPLDKGASCPAELLVDAATLAAHFSDARGEGTCEVSYVPRRHVRKPRGSAPGAVTYDREKVIVVRIEKDRLDRLLASKQEA